MGINFNGPGFAAPTAALFYDTGAYGATSYITKVAGTPIAAALEIQSTNGGFVLPRMTTTQRNALTPLVDGTMVYDSTVGDIFTRRGAAWVQQTPATGVQYASVNLTAANLIAMNGAPVQILPAPGAGLMYVIQGFSLNADFVAAAFTGGGNIYLQYTTTAGAARTASGNIAATLLTTFAANQSSYASGTAASVPQATAANAPVAITNATAAFAAGDGTAVCHVWYSIITA